MRKPSSLNERDVICSWLPLYHDMGLIASFVMPVLLRVPVVLLSPFDWVRAPAKLLQLISAYKGTLTWLPNFAYNFMAQKIRERDLETCRFVIAAGLHQLQRANVCSQPQHVCGEVCQVWLAARSLTTCYAMAENTFAVTQSTRARYREDAARRIFLSAGKPLPNVQVRILSESRSAAGWRIGEIAIKSDCMLTGYYHRDDLTAQAIGRWLFSTGDLGYHERRANCL